MGRCHNNIRITDLISTYCMKPKGHEQQGIPCDTPEEARDRLYRDLTPRKQSTSDDLSGQTRG